MLDTVHEVHPLRVRNDIPDNTKLAAWMCPFLTVPSLYSVAHLLQICCVFFLMTEMSSPVTVESRFFSAHGGKQLAELVLDFLRGRHGLRDLRPDELSVAPPQTVDRYLERLGSHA